MLISECNYFQNNNISPSLKIMEAWDKGYNGSGITVAIVDDGLQKDHPDLDANVVSISP